MQHNYSCNDVNKCVRIVSHSSLLRQNYFLLLNQNVSNVTQGHFYKKQNDTFVKNYIR